MYWARLPGSLFGTLYLVLFESTVWLLHVHVYGTYIYEMTKINSPHTLYVHNMYTCGRLFLFHGNKTDTNKNCFHFKKVQLYPNETYTVRAGTAPTHLISTLFLHFLYNNTWVCAFKYCRFVTGLLHCCLMSKKALQSVSQRLLRICGLRTGHRLCKSYMILVTRWVNILLWMWTQ